MHPLFIKLARHAVLVMAMALAGGCASYSGSNLVPGQSSQADARMSLGEPAAIHKAPAGQPYAESWEYPHGPAGRDTYMVRFDSGGRFVASEQVLTVNNTAKIEYGKAGRDDVRKILGRPGLKFPLNNGGEMWDYAALTTEGVPRKIRITVTFDRNGTAVSGGESFDPEEWSFDGGAAL